MTVVRVRHIRQAGLCAAGTRAWFARHPQLGYVEFLRDGIDAEQLLALNDHFANQVVAKAKEEEEQGVNYG